jgi:uncharacterized protein YdeI (YjbR/CyaY-like superfamily)
MNPKVDKFIDKAKKWQDELTLLRTIILDCMLTEEVKWKQPCYTYQNANVVLIHGFKEYCAIMFFKGALLSNDKGILIQQTENVQATRQIRFSNIKEIVKLKATIKAYIFEAIEIEKAGLKVDMKKSTDLVFPKEFEDALNKNSKLKKAFEALTPGRQRAYNLYFSAPKQSKTIETRIENYTDKIIKGIGFNDCTCGLSQKMPYCDGSHKQLR